MSISLYERTLAEPGGFFSYVYQSLRSAGGAIWAEGPRPLPRVTKPRDHQSAWMEVEGKRVLLDMSDHVFLFDLEALKACDVYLKTNLYRPSAEAVLEREGLTDHLPKLKPFFSFAGYLDSYLKPDLIRGLYDRWKGRTEDVCDVVGVYEDLRAEGGRSCYAEEGPEVNTNQVHFWARAHTVQALRGAGLSGTLRLTSRYQRELEDGDLIQTNLSQRAYRRAILRAQCMVINTLPHALLPWKATEALSLGRPFLVDVPPLIEFPDEFQLREGDHYLSLLPAADFADLEQGRVLHRYSIRDFDLGVEKVAALLRDPSHMAHMNEQVRIYREEKLTPENVVACVRRLVSEAI